MAIQSKQEEQPQSRQGARISFSDLGPECGFQVSFTEAGTLKTIGVFYDWDMIHAVYKQLGKIIQSHEAKHPNQEFS